jgi:plasmid stabilization system protein ParE
MKNNVTISLGAQKDIEHAIDWYDSQKMGLGKRLLKEIRSNIKFIQQNPLACPVWYNEIHVTVLKTFPYSVHYFYDKKNNSIFISGVFKHEQNPDNWLR